MTDLTDLIARLEAASEGNWELNEAIYEALGAVRPTDGSEWWISPEGDRKHYSQLVPRYTTSLDAALSLVPEEGCYLKIEQRKECWFGGFEVPASPYFWGAIAATAALALCIAALKARSAA